jgi:hypothetical protein
MRSLAVVIVLFCLSACSHDVAFRDPMTGASASCHDGTLADINPWSQADQCAENYKAEGWVVK